MSPDATPLLLAHEPFAAPTRIDLPDDVAVVQLHRAGVTVDDVEEVFDSGFSVLAGLGPVGPGFAIYRGDMAGTFDLTIGFPVAPGEYGDLPAGVERATFPGGPAQVTSHLGSCDDLEESWAALVEQSGGARDVQIEVYVTDPSRTAVEDLRTDLVVQLP